MPSGVVSKILNGNNMFASLNCLTFQRTCRRDDLESLCNLLIYLMNSPCTLPQFELPDNHNKKTLTFEQTNYYLVSYKKGLTLEKMCWLGTNTYQLANFCREVELLKYKDRPDYDKLRTILYGLYQYQKQKEFEIYFGFKQATA